MSSHVMSSVLKSLFDVRLAATASVVFAFTSALMLSHPLALASALSSLNIRVAKVEDFREPSRNKEVPMNKKYIVRLSDEERKVCEQTIKDLKGKSEKLRRAQILLKADVEGPGWKDEKISEAVGCRTRTVENVRMQLVLEGFEAALQRKKRAMPPTTAQGRASAAATRRDAPAPGTALCSPSPSRGPAPAAD